MTAPLLYGIFFLSGAAALLFQTLWFRLAGLTFGNSVWASSLVLASFMGGLALGNGLAAWRRERGRSALRLYALLELLVGATGFGLVVLIPWLSGALVPVFRALQESPWLLNLLRLAATFLLMLVPATAMGATLPVVVTALASPTSAFGGTLGRLYGWNTLGAVAGTLGGEMVLIDRFGLTGTGVCAGLFNLAAAAGALGLARAIPTREPAPRVDPRAVDPGSGRRSRWLLAAAGLGGGIVLALEVVWFRFLQLDVFGTSQTFAFMLAVVLVGISLGGFLAGHWASARPSAHRWMPALALAAGVATVSSYVGFPGAQEGWGTDAPLATLKLAAGLMLPACLLSGVLFTLLGVALKEELVAEALTTGALTLANTAGAMVGSLLAGFVLLPRLGTERSFFALSLVYGVVAFCLWSAQRHQARPALDTWALRGAWALFAVVLALFPFGLLEKVHVSRVVGRFASEGSRPVAFREGLTETILYLQRDRLGEPLGYRLVTNAFSMSATGFAAERYMKLFVYWPLALQPRARTALLVSYGVGSTAKALTDASQLESIDVVDISADILEMGRIVYPPPATPPLDDPRVRVHVEDGRFFLLTTDRRFDLITAEPPPPRNAGVVNLYSQEYFSLVRARLSEGGIATHWLPVSDLNLPSARAIIRGFCNAFPDCSLWNGSSFNWMLVGTRDARGPVSGEAFSRLWQDPRIGPTLRDLDFETPARLGSTFLADAAALSDLTDGTPPVVDDFPRRISPAPAAPEDVRFYEAFVDADAARERFRTSPLVRSLWPPELVPSTLARFEEQRIFNKGEVGNSRVPVGDRFALLYEALAETDSFTLPLVLAGSEPREQAIVRQVAAGGADNSLVDYLLGVRLLAERDYLEAARRFDRVAEREPGFKDVARFRGLALCLGGEAARGGDALAQVRQDLPPGDPLAGFWSSLEAACRGRRVRARSGPS
jgi:spermidine synthase